MRLLRGAGNPILADQATDGFIEVNDRLETNVPGIWAIGDVSGGPQFTHASLDDFRILRDNVFGNGSRSRSDRYVPSTLSPILNWRT